MKKLLLLSLVLSITFLGFSQQRVPASKTLRNVTKTAFFETPTDGIVDMGIAENPYVTNSKELMYENVIGNTFYDLQSNAFLANRIHVYEDGTIGAVWTRGIDASAFSDRGTGYNYYDGTSWGDEPTARIEDVRTGWPSYAPLGANGELVVSHDFPNGLVLNKRDVKGTGDWSSSTLFGPTGNEGIAWPRIVTAGEDNNTIHLLVNSYDEWAGQTSAMFYYRSQDAGETWDIEAEVLEGTGSDYYTAISADDYVWAEPRGGAIAFLVGGAWYDLFMMKSIDNGDTWEKTVIWEHPYPMFDWETTIADTLYCVDNSASITLDNDGMAHVVFGISRVMHLELGTTYNFYPYVDGIGYWNETMPTFSNNLHALSPYSDDPESELVENVSLIGWFQDANGNGTIDLISDLPMSYREIGLSTMPSVVVDGWGDIMLAYSSTCEDFDNGTYNYKHVWVRAKQFDGAWGEFEDIDTDVIHMFDECIYPSIGQYINPINQSAYIMYNTDFEPGVALDEDHEYVDNKTRVAHFKLFVDVGVDEASALNFTVSQNVPNPAVSSTSIKVNTEANGAINLNVVNLLGQVIYQENVTTNSHSYTFNVNVSDFDSGIYFYTVEIGNNTVTNKMIVK